MKLIIQWVIGIAAIAITAWFLPGITIQGEQWVALGVSAVILGLANLLVRPVLKVLTLPINVMTLGLFSIVINGVVLVVASWLSLRLFGVGLVIDNFLTAILAAVVIGVITGVLGFFLIRD